MKIALVSFDPKWEDKVGNLAEVEMDIKIAKRANAEYVIFPELALTGFTMNSNILGENVEDSQSMKTIQGIALHYNINILIGIILEKDGMFFNSCIAVDSHGEIAAIYDKIHPFSYGDETEHYTKGDKLVSVPWEGKWGLTICYDLRFPELYQALSRDSLLLVNVASWPATRRLHWETLLRARAIENQSFMIGVNRTGIDGNGVDYVEGSMVIDPEGKTVVPIYVKSEIKVYEINISDALSYRAIFPLKKDRRPSLYKGIL